MIVRREIGISKTKWFLVYNSLVYDQTDYDYMDILKTSIQITEDVGEWTSDSEGMCDTIEYDNGLWLVPEWLEMPDEGKTMPARIIRLDVLRHQKAGFDGIDYVLNNPIPRSVLNGQIPKQAEALYVVIESPDIVFPTLPGIH